VVHRLYAQSEIAEQVFEAIQNGGSWRGEMKTKTGRIVLTLMRANCVVDESGRIGLISVCADITERKQKEAATANRAGRLVVEIAQHPPVS